MACGLSDIGGAYYQLGGHGYVPVRFHPDTLPNMARRGWLMRAGYWKATINGRAIVAAQAPIPLIAAP